MALQRGSQLRHGLLRQSDAPEVSAAVSGLKGEEAAVQSRHHLRQDSSQLMDRVGEVRPPLLGLDLALAGKEAVVEASVPLPGVYVQAGVLEPVPGLPNRLLHELDAHWPELLVGGVDDLPVLGHEVGASSHVDAEGRVPARVLGLPGAHILRVVLDRLALTPQLGEVLYQCLDCHVPGLELHHPQDA